MDPDFHLYSSVRYQSLHYGKMAALSIDKGEAVSYRDLVTILIFGGDTSLS